MRTLFIALTLSGLIGCSSISQDQKTPVGMSRTTISQRIAGQRL